MFDQETINDIQKKIEYEFKNKELLEQAFTRRSYSMENGGEDNEVLEFIGDAALNMVVVKILSEEFGYFNQREQRYTYYVSSSNTADGTFSSEKDEGELTEIKKMLVKKSTLSDAIDNLELQCYLVMGRGDRKKHIERSNSTKEDLFEAIIGAIALDSKWDIKTIQEAVMKMLKIDDIIGFDKDSYIEEIQKWSLKHHDVLPEYSVCSYLPREINIGAPDWARPMLSIINQFKPGELDSNTKYASLLALEDEDVPWRFIGYGHSKNQAKEEASRLAYEYLDEHGLLWTIQDEIEKPCKRLAINQLETLARRGYFSLPTYNYYEDYDEDGNPVWKCKCHIHIEEKDIYYWATSSSKKDAKKDAAWKMLKHVLDMEEN
ncbi:ribonuclease III domain-containing protein [uncultured Solobacterium sp.]|uniref:ribonuclease III domain-containing protein n=1 Tax=uncultured Solobacterium sp. TaxID=747375 RepID=UPI0028D5CEFA|nr:ribonuclease III domain-containing protein [uncultured Solobacterium sp.]